MNAERFARICKSISAGATVINACTAEHCGSNQVYDYLTDSASEPEKLSYARAVNTRLERLADEITDIADRRMDPRDKQVRIDARKWLLAKLLNRKYGDSLSLQHSGNLTTRVIRIPDKSAEGAAVLTSANDTQGKQ